MSKLAKALTAAAGNAGGDNLYVEDVFSTYLYDGNGSTQTITNGIDLDGEGGLVWGKSRSQSSIPFLTDTERGTNSQLATDRTNLAYTQTNAITSFNSDGFTLGSNANLNGSGRTQVAWTFRKAEKFFDVVTYTGDGVAGRTIAHNLGSTPGFIVVKRTNAAYSWCAWHSGVNSGNAFGFLDTTAAFNTSGGALWGDGTNYAAPTSTEFSVSTDPGVNASGSTYVAYLFASDAGGFGDDGSENIIKCGSYTGTGSTSNPAIVNCGFEPQWVLIKNAGSSENWILMDSMRGIVANGAGDDSFLKPNSSDAEETNSYINLTATGFEVRTTSNVVNENGKEHIYIAIRRPMKTPESGTEVFKANYVDNGASFPDMLSGFPVDMYFRRYVNTTNNPYWFTRLLGTNVLDSTTTGAEQSFSANSTAMDSNVGVMNIFSTNNTDFYGWMFKRATGFFDVVAWTGDGVNYNHAHNLNVVPELMIVKTRGASEDWWVYHKDLGADHRLSLQSSGAKVLRATWLNTVPTNEEYYFGVRTNGRTYISYLFATLAGVSKVGSYTGSNNVGSQTIDCGFSTGARFVLIKNTGIGEWFVFDVERGITVGSTDGVLQLQSTSQEYTESAWAGADMIQPHSSGFTLTANGQLNNYTANYIFLAIA